MISTQSKLPYIFEALHLAPQLDQNFKTHKFCSGNFFIHLSMCVYYFLKSKIKSLRPQHKARLRCSRLRSRLRIPPKLKGFIV